MRVEREDGTVEVLIRPNFGFGVGFYFLAGLILLIGMLSAITGQHFPHLTWIGTAIWAFSVGFVFLLLGYVFTGTKDHFIFTYQGVQAQFARYRFLQWTVTISSQTQPTIVVETIGSSTYYRVLVRTKGRQELVIGNRLSAEAAWQLASMVAEPGQWNVVG